MSSLRKLIREMILSEAYEHADDEMVDFKNIDLYYEYDKLNNLLFNDELPRIPLYWKNTKARHGFVKHTVQYANSKDLVRAQKILGLFLTQTYKIPYKMFKSVLAHEMIHVKNIQDKIRSQKPYYKGDGHGYDFIEEMNRINSLGIGFNIKIAEDEMHDVSDHIKGREIYIGLLNRDGVFGIIGMTPSAFKEKNVLEKIFTRVVKQGKYKNVHIDYYKTNSPYFLKYKIQRNFNTSVSFSDAKDSDIMKLKEVGEFVDSFDVSYGMDDSKNSLTKVELPKQFSSPKSLEPIKKPEVNKPVLSDEVKEVNRRIMSIFKTVSDKTIQNKLFDILKTEDPIQKAIKIKSYNQNHGLRFGFIEF